MTGRFTDTRPAYRAPPAAAPLWLSDAAVKSVTEAQFQRTVVAAFRAAGFRVWHNTIAWRSDAGFPDLLCVHPDGRLVVAELKRESGRVSPAQQAWLDALAAVPGARVFVWKPSDWNAIERVLTGAQEGAGR